MRGENTKLTKSRLKKIALMPTDMFKSQLDQISNKGREVLKTLEEYKFFIDQTSRVMKNDPALTEVIVKKQNNLEEASAKIYDIVFEIENLDISALYERQQEVTQEDKPNVENNEKNIEENKENNKDDEITEDDIDDIFDEEIEEESKEENNKKDKDNKKEEKEN